MYKVGQTSSGVSRPSLPNIQRSVVYNSNVIRNRGGSTAASTTTRFIDHRSTTGRYNDISVANHHHMPVFNNRKLHKNHHHSSQVGASASRQQLKYQQSTHANNEAINFLRDSWRAFSLNQDGKPDVSIVYFTPKSDQPKGFVAFDVDKYLTERLLKSVDLDPKLVTG